MNTIISIVPLMSAADYNNILLLGGIVLFVSIVLNVLFAIAFEKPSKKEELEYYKDKVDTLFNENGKLRESKHEILNKLKRTETELERCVTLNSHDLSTVDLYTKFIEAATCEFERISNRNILSAKITRDNWGIHTNVSF